MSTHPQVSREAPSGRAQLALVAAVFFLPLLFGSWLYYSGSGLQPDSRSNHGALLEPIVNLHDALPKLRTELPAGTRWLLVYPGNSACGASCHDALYTLRQSRLMLGKNMNRLTRVLLQDDAGPDTVLIEHQYPGLRVIRDTAWRRLLAARRPGQLSDGGFYLVDPLGNLVMYFAPEIAPGDMVDDIKHLLELSQIG